MGASPLLPADWPAPRGVHGLTTLRYGAGVSVAPFERFNLGNRHAADGDDPAAVDANRAALIAVAELPSASVWLRQVHGTGVFRAGGSDAVPTASTGSRRSSGGAQGDASNEPEADAAVTSVPGTVLAILTADCLPVLFCADDGSEVGAAHAGWRGLAGGVLEATVNAMATSPERLIAWLGPAAGPQHYEVGAEVRDAFVSRDRWADNAFIATRPGHWNVDLYALARRRLVQAGLSAKRIYGGGLCTIADPARFYSHRRDQRTGRMASVVWVEPHR
ncbi:peptidoglycan editing factor PgeF [Lysobacter sp. H21R4]|uniref:peptidoglycan editing factor PgeF n=1 Tax=Lysobacter sp. H21R4 TaxID=2781021 RepID=UPI001886F81D|nr:peptidoglycan editing factor PgeF [Lysobacter sp. H21R4]QOY63100.1 peptidoglycan editing factor PgeF [Lysobacter sp. H21R4]